VARGRKNIPQEVVDYARELYLTVNEKGERVYSYQEIANKIDERFNVKLTKVTIKNWADKHNWPRLLSQAIVVSAYDEEGKKETESIVTKVVRDLPADEELIEKLARAKRTVLINHLRMARKLYRAVEDHDPNDRRFPRLCEVANQVGKAIYEMLSEVEEAKEELESFPTRIVIREIRVERGAGEGD